MREARNHSFRSCREFGSGPNEGALAECLVGARLGAIGLAVERDGQPEYAGSDHGDEQRGREEAGVGTVVLDGRVDAVEAERRDRRPENGQDRGQHVTTELLVRREAERRHGFLPFGEGRVIRKNALRRQIPEQVYHNNAFFTYRVRRLLTWHEAGIFKEQ